METQLNKTTLALEWCGKNRGWKIPIEILRAGKSCIVDGGFCSYERGIFFKFTNDGKLELHSPGRNRGFVGVRYQEWAPEARYKTDYPVSPGDVFLAAAYWAPRDGIIRLTPEGIRKAREMLNNWGLEITEGSWSQPSRPSAGEQRQDSSCSDALTTSYV